MCFHNVEDRKWPAHVPGQHLCCFGEAAHE